MPSKLALFTQHSRSWRTNRYVYPVISRRSKGLSIGVNLNPDKVCNFDCVYCSVDRRTPGDAADVELDVLAGELDHLLTVAASGELFAAPPFDATPAALRRINDIAFSGDGEPTSFAGFPAACMLAADLLARHRLSEWVKLVVITNATLLHRPAVSGALAFLDAHNGEIWAKLDAGTEAYYRTVERTTIPLARVLENIALAGRARAIVIQSLFMKLHGEGPDEAEISAYVARLEALVKGGCQIKGVQVYTVARDTAEDFVTPLDDAALDAIAERVRAMSIRVETFYGPT